MNEPGRPGRDEARLQLTVRNTHEETRQQLLEEIRRMAENMDRVAGLPEELLPEVIVSEESTVVALLELLQ